MLILSELSGLDFKDYITDEWKYFIEYQKIKRIQQESFEKDKLNKTSAVLQRVFAMTYSCLISK